MLPQTEKPYNIHDNCPRNDGWEWPLKKGAGEGFECPLGQGSNSISLFVRLGYAPWNAAMARKHEWLTTHQV